jgi:transposase-like protein
VSHGFWRSRDELRLPELAQWPSSHYGARPMAVPLLGDQDGRRIAVRRSAPRDLAAAEAFFHAAWNTIEVSPERLTTNRHGAYPCALRYFFGDQIPHRTNRSWNNHVVQAHQGLKQRHRAIGGCKPVETASRVCGVRDTVRACLRPQSQHLNRGHSRSDATAIGGDLPNGWE